MASLKQTQYLREAWGDDARSTIYYIDIRAIDRFEDFYEKVQADSSVTFVKSKPARIAEDGKTRDPIIHGVDTEGTHRYATRHDLVVLAIGMAPSVRGAHIPAEVLEDSSGFLEGRGAAGIIGAGCASGALDVNRAVQSATAATLRAIQIVGKTARAEA